MPAATTNHDSWHTEVNALKNDLGRVRKDLTDMTSTVLEHGRKTAQTAGADIERHVNESLETVQGYIKERPIATTLCAMGAGLLIGALLRRR